MTTSLVGSLLLHLGALSSSPLTIRDRAIVHNAAQLVHCAAQGKVGSGFDVSAAIWGSHLYRRFDPAVLQPLMDAEVPKESSSEGAPKVSISQPSSYSVHLAHPLYFPSHETPPSRGPNS